MVNSLEESSSFARTHFVISQLKKCAGWSQLQKKKLMKIALSNRQVKSILTDYDVKLFFMYLIQNDDSELADAIREEVEG